MKTIFIIVLAGTTSWFGLAQSPQDEELVRKVVLSFQDDFNEGGFRNAIEYTTSDWEHLNPLGGISKGRDKVLEEVRAVHQTFLKGVTMTIEHMTIRFITTDVALVNVIHKMSIYEMPKGTWNEDEKHVKTYVVVKQDGKWLLTHDQNTIMAKEQ
jgi:uncharacterized protein (TIGR02246 family)